MQFIAKSSGILTAQFFKSMKILAIILLAFCMQVSAESFGQKVNLDLKNVEIQTALKEIRNQTGYLFFYKIEDLKKAGRISIQIHNAGVEEAMDQILAHTGLYFEIIDKTIILKKTTGKEVGLIKNVAIDVSGTVTDQSGKPLGGATIAVRGTSHATSTDAQGNFTLNNIILHAGSKCDLIIRRLKPERIEY